MDLKDVGRRIQTIRLESKLSQEELADLVGVDQSTVSHWESGHHSPDVLQVIRLLRALNISASDLMPDRNTP